MRRLSPGVDTERFHPHCGGAAVRRQLGLGPDQPVVVCVGRLVRRKGQDTLVRAWPDVLHSHPSAVLLLVGDGPSRRRLERIAGAVGVTGSVVFAGRVDGADVPAYMDAGDVFAMPCRSRLWGLEVEAWGIVFLEAQACGLPVVVGSSGGAGETVLPGSHGRVVRGRREVAEALVDLVQQARTGGPRLAGEVALFDWRVVADLLRSLLG
jgi:phosphatidylinositol alpha-1,6-mannosyltransferase